MNWSPGLRVRGLHERPHRHFGGAARYRALSGQPLPDSDTATEDCEQHLPGKLPALERRVSPIDETRRARRPARADRRS